MAVKQLHELPVPTPLYPCEGCVETSSDYTLYPAKELTWHEADANFGEGWYCEDCGSQDDNHGMATQITLDEVLAYWEQRKHQPSVSHLQSLANP